MLPSSARLLASMRTTAPKDRELLFAAVQHLAVRTAEAYGTEAVVHMHQNMPVLINDAHLASDADDWLARLGVDGAEPMRSLGGDDFSYYCDEVPSIMCFAGVETAGLPVRMVRMRRHCTIRDSSPRRTRSDSSPMRSSPGTARRPSASWASRTTGEPFPEVGNAALRSGR